VSILGMILGTARLVVGVDDEPTGGVRVFIGSRHLGHYAVFTEAEGAQRVRDAWATARGHVTIDEDQIGNVYLENATARTFPG